MVRMKRILTSTLLFLLCSSPAFAVTIKIGDADRVTETWNPGQLLTEGALSGTVKSIIAKAHRAHKDKLNRNWFVFKDTYFMSITKPTCDVVKKGGLLRVTNILVFNNSKFIDTGVSFVTPENKVCLAFVVAVQ